MSGPDVGQPDVGQPDVAAAPGPDMGDPDAAASPANSAPGLARSMARTLPRLVLAGVFIYAALSKIQSPLELASIILGYRILPIALAAPSALVLPLVELFAAMAVLVGPRAYRRSGALILGALLLIFMAAALQGLIRGLDFECGCFGPAGRRPPGAMFFLQDGALLLAAALVWRLDRPAARKAPDPGPGP